MDTFLDFFWFMMWAFLWIIWIMLLFRVFADIFRSDSSGWAKAGWTIFVIILPILGVLIYLIAEGGHMARRAVVTAQAMDEAQQDYIRSAAGSVGGADQLEKLASLRDRGVISDAEFEAEKAKVLSQQGIASIELVFIDPPTPGGGTTLTFDFTSERGWATS